MDVSNTNNELAEALRKRTKKFVIDNIIFFRTLPKTEEAKFIGRQLLRASSSVGANYRAACRARSKAEFHAKLSITIEEADECLFWMEVLAEAQIVNLKDINCLLDEANQILRILSASRKTVSSRKAT